MNLFGKKISLAGYSLVLALFTLAAFHAPFFRRVLQNIEGGFNGVVIFVTALLLLLVLDSDSRSLQTRSTVLLRSILSSRKQAE